MNSKDILIIGGGLGGLVTGYLLSKKGNKVTILEKENYLGGLASSFDLGKISLERAYHHVFKTDKDFLGLIKELDLKKKIKWHRSSTALYWDKKMYPFLTAADLLKFKPLNIIDKVRMGLVAVSLKKDKNWKKYEKELAYKWMKKMVGKNSYKVVWEPLLKGKFGKDYKKISMAWLWARIHTRGNSSDDKGREVLGYMDKGFQSLIDKMEEFIKKKGGKIQLNTAVDCLKELKKEYDLIIDTRPSKEVEYLGAIDLVFTSKQNLSSYYWHNINDLKSPFLAFIQHTNLVGNKNYDNKYVYYIGSYLDQINKYFKMTDLKLKKEWFDYLKKIFPNFKEKEVIDSKVFKFKYAQQIVTTNYSKKIPKYKVNNKLYKLNFAQIYPEDRGMNYAVKEAKKLVDLILKNNLS